VARTRTADEAERQAKGEDVIASAAEEDRALADAQAAVLMESGVEGQDDDRDDEPSDDAEDEDQA